ncbi:hypothetical protein TWF696_000468 [Orbilia brochopaga]|uniref:ubiquitinyl hydrolase 1 n=1 Tax=Orbilia brochopaga TaxID=3140254 RepID=A0AAV9VHR1_9PEZI
MSQRKRRLATQGDEDAGPSQRRRISNITGNDDEYVDEAHRQQNSPPRSVKNRRRARAIESDGDEPPEHPQETLKKSKSFFDYITTHVFLPPKLPDKAVDKSLERSADHFLLTLLLEAADEFGNQLGLEEFPWWRAVQKSIKDLVLLYRPDDEQPWLSAEKLSQVLRSMNEGDFTTLHIRKQNAGLVIRRQETEMIVESFEACCLAEKVADCRKRLRCSFPGPRTCVSVRKFQQKEFIDSLSMFLAYLDGSSIDATDGNMGAINDAGSTSPSFITNLLTGIIRGIGSEKSSRDTDICKRIADSVLGTEKSVWRRSPMWLVVRVGLQSTLKLHSTVTRDWYKIFMAYFMSKLAERAMKDELVSQDYLYIMSAKVARRVQKLNNNTPKFFEDTVAAVLKAVSGYLERRWETFGNLDAKPLSWAPANLNFSTDSKLKLNNSIRHILSTLNGDTSLADWELAQQPFTPGFFFRVTNPILLDPDLDLGKFPKKDRAVLLMDIETWVDKSLDGFVAEHPEDETAVVQLGRLFDRYFTMAVNEYEGNPENMSAAFLTGFELWCAMDRITTACIPLLAKYHPEIVCDDLNCLVLPTRRQMQRLAKLQIYVMDREANAINQRAAFFTERLTEASFQCQYYDQSASLQELKDSVEAAAAIARRNIRAALRVANERYRELIMEASRLDHAYTAKGNHRSMRYCLRCSKESEARNITVGKHEWPLPDKNKDPDLFKAIVFELDCPPHFAAWRDTTFRMLVNTSAVLQFTETDPETKAQEHLQSYTGLKDFYNDDRSAGIVLASPNKSIGREGGLKIQLPAVDEEVLADFSLRPRYWYKDGAGGHWVRDFIKLKGLWDKRIFSYTLPKGSLYKPLQFAIWRTDHTSNEILALQHKCPPKLSSHEFYEYGVLRAGCNLQWLNIAKTLRARSLSLNHQEVSYLILQAAWEAGPAMRGVKNIYLREAHRIFDTSSTVSGILNEIDVFLETIQTNWLEMVTVATLVALACRCLALAKKDQQAVITQAIELILKLRGVTYGWIKILRQQVKQEQNEGSLSRKLQNLMHCAAVCRMTYNVPDDHAQDLFDGVIEGEGMTATRDPEPLSIFLETGAIIRDNLPPKREHVEDYFRHAIDRSNRLSHRWESRCRDLIRHDATAIDLAIENQWQPHRRRTDWEPAAEPNEHWLQTTTRPIDGDRDVQISLNLLDGQILMDSIPFGRLPHEYTQHPSYGRIFGTDVLAVGPSSMKGMQFETRFMIEGHRVHLAIKGEELIIRSQKNDRVYELIPFSILEGDLYKLLIDEYAHWVDINDAKVQFRRLQRLWDSDGYEWTMSLTGRGFTLVRVDDPTVCAIEPSSSTCHDVNEILGCLEGKDYIVVTVQNSPGEMDAVVHADIGRLNLKFSSKANTFVCRNFPGFVVDADQNLGCFRGLANKLVLRKDNERMVLVPFGEVSLKLINDFTLTRIHNAKTYQAYTVDQRLGRLKGNGSTTSRLYQIYLHAVTSSPSCRVDSLTRRTGTEEAASLLGSGAVISFQELNSADIQLLHLIAQLTPKRTFGALAKKDTQQHGRIETVVWNGGLSFTCQRDIFRVGSKQIVEYWMEIKGFMPREEDITETLDKQNETDAAIEEAIQDKKIEDGVERGVETLLRRAASRVEVFYAFIEDTWTWSNEPGSARLRNGGSGDLAEEDDPNPIIDRTYTARDGRVQRDGDKEGKVCQLAKLLINWTTGMEPPNLWGTLSSFIVNGVKGGNDTGKLQISDWLMKRPAGDIWCPLFEACRRTKRQEDTFKLIFALCSLTYRDGFDPRLVHALAAAAVLEDFRGDNFKIPKGHFDVCIEHAPTREKLTSIIKPHVIAFEMSRFNALPREQNETQAAAASRRNTQYQLHLSIQRSDLQNYYLNGWPKADPAPPNARQYSVIDVGMVHERVVDHLSNVYRIHQLKEAIDRIQVVLNHHHDVKYARSNYSFHPDLSPAPRDKEQVTLEEIMSEVAAPALDAVGNGVEPLTKSSLSRAVEVVQPILRLKPLQNLSRNLSGPRNSQFQKLYAEDLTNSIEALKNFDGNTGGKNLPLSLGQLEEHVGQWREHLEAIEMAIRSRLEPPHFKSDFRIVPAQGFLCQAGLWPRVTAFSLLRHISCHISPIPPGWKEAIVTYGTAIRELGRAERLLEFAKREDVQGFWEALADTAHSKWDGTTRPDWLLLELENNFCMRDVQAEIATQMISPTSGESTVMQMNMGEGKSSVIIPAVAATLADTTKLVRVVVLKPLSREMFNLLRSKLGGLCDRRIYFLPFHRGLKIEPTDTHRIKAIYEECMSDGGILLVQNEHLLSFKLLGLEKVCVEEEGDRSNISNELYKVQKWLDANSRDLLDESDEILRVNHTLVYTVGSSGPIDNQPYRWLHLLKVLDVVRAQLPELQSRFPQGFEAVARGGDSFPSVRILQPKAADALMNAVATELVYGDTHGHQWFSTVSTEKRKTILKFITTREFSPEEYQILREILRGGATFNAALLFRGLIAFDILRFCMQEKRWRVDYGADFTRTQLAVPYKAKDTPSSASDFAHPEVLLCLTCLSWYNYGLVESEIAHCLQLVENTESPEDEYRKWIKNHGGRLDNRFQHLQSLKGVNVHHTTESAEVLCPLLTHNKYIIDFYLEHVVFPKFAKQYPYKLTSSGWDLVERRAHITSGFSGTNDNKYLLPLSIEQHDLESHKHTNALVLNYLLGAENNYFIRAAHSITGQKMKVEELLDTIVAQSPPISVLLDVGAQVLELENRDVAKEWLERAAKVDPEKWQAAIFFNPKDELCVIDRMGRVELLMTSNFAKQMGSCLCYLDDAHTRGTDLQFPLDSRALVTLGPKTTKDRLIQGAMRMRKLGKGHSVVFCAPSDVENQILAISGGRSKVENIDVLKWTLRETCKQTKKNAELWAAQGFNYLHRKAAQDEYVSTRNWRILRQRLFELEELSLKNLYDLKDRPGASYISQLSRLDISGSIIRGRIIDRCQMFDIDNVEGLSQELDEEQEREVEQQVEVEREVQRPAPAKALKHKIHKDVTSFIKTGRISDKSVAVEPAMNSLRKTSIRPLIRPGSWSTKLLVSRDFAQTVEITTDLLTGRQIDYQDDFIRPVSYILTSTKTNRRRAKMLIISPYEAHQLLDIIRASSAVRLHIYMPKITKAMRTFEDLKWLKVNRDPFPRKWCMPAVLMDQLNLFAGQLYFRQKTSYLRTAEWLSLRTNEVADDSQFYEDGFIPFGHRRLKRGDTFTSTFKTSPVPCMQGLMAMRRKGKRYDPTHIGQLLHGKFLPDNEFDEPDSDIEGLFNEDDAVSADDADDADYIKEEVEPPLHSAAAAAGVSPPREFIEMQVDAEAGEIGWGPAQEGEEEFGGLPPIKSEEGSDGADEFSTIDRSRFYRDSSPIVPDAEDPDTVMRSGSLDDDDDEMDEEW